MKRGQDQPGIRIVRLDQPNLEGRKRGVGYHLRRGRVAEKPDDLHDPDCVVYCHAPNPGGENTRYSPTSGIAIGSVAPELDEHLAERLATTERGLWAERRETEGHIMANRQIVSMQAGSAPLARETGVCRSRPDAPPLPHALGSSRQCSAIRQSPQPSPPSPGRRDGRGENPHLRCRRSPAIRGRTEDG